MGVCRSTFNQLHRLTVADKFATAGFRNHHDISADIAPVHLTGILDVYHLILHSIAPGPTTRSNSMREGIGIIGFGSLQNLSVFLWEYEKIISAWSLVSIPST
jgi:hypothetical protein